MKKIIVSLFALLVLAGGSLDAQAEVLQANVLKLEVIGTDMGITFLPDFQPSEPDTQTLMHFYGEKAAFRAYLGTAYVVGVPNNLKLIDKSTGVITLLEPNKTVTIAKNLVVSMAEDLLVGVLVTMSGETELRYLTVVSRTPSDSAWGKVWNKNLELTQANLKGTLRYHISNSF